MKTLILVILTTLLSPISFSQTIADSIIVQMQKQEKTMNELGGRINNISQQIQTVNDSLKNIRTNSPIEAQTLTANYSNAVDSIKAHPAILYKNYIFNHNKKSNADKVVVFAGFVMLLLLFYWGLRLFKTTALCKDESFDADHQLKDDKLRPFSYGRVQLFWWTMIILSCYVIFFALTGYLLPLNSTTVLLLGGGVAVSVIGKIIDANQIKDNNQAVPTRHQDLHDTKNFFTDILSDDTGISIHRFQAVAFNIIFGVGFVSAFFENLSSCKYPFTDFEQWQLTLLGISATAYLGLKARENGDGTKPERTESAMIKSKEIHAPTASEQPAISRQLKNY